MKIFSYIVIALAFALIAFNATKINLDNPLQGDSEVAIICSISALCAIILLATYLQSRKILNKLNGN